MRPVIFINIMGGLGNQLFQIACAFALAQREKAELQILHKKDNGNRPVYWNTVLSNVQSFLVEAVPALPVWKEDLPTMYKHIPCFAPESQGLCLSGYFQTSKYFYNEEIKSQIRNLFRPQSQLIEQVTVKYASLFQNKERVVIVHSRQTDYVPIAHFHGPLSGIYYQKAISEIKKVVKNPFFVLTGDDNNYWQRVRPFIDNIFCHDHIILEEENEIVTFALLQQFQYFIMSNSSFIWWCVWLSSEPNYVIVPDRWFGPYGPFPFEDIYEEGWKKISDE